MSRSKLIAFIALITLAFSIALVASALAGEKVKFRSVFYCTKWEQVPVGDEEGHTVAVYEAKGIYTNLQGKKFLDGWATRESSLMDIDGKSGTWSGQGYTEVTDPDGDKIYVAWEGKNWEVKKVKKDVGEGTTRLVKGTGKWQGIQGKGTWVAPPGGGDNRWYSNCEWDVQLPR